MRLALCSLLLVGCGTTISTVALNPPPRPLSQRPASAVAIYASAPPARPHVDVAVLAADPGLVSAQDMLATVRARAGAMGCDGIVIADVKHQGTGGIEGLTATCIVYDDAAAR